MKKIFLMAVWVMLAMPLFAQTWSKDLEKTAKKGDVEAQFIVGAAYLSGDGVKANTKKAVQWLFMAAEAGNTKAIDKLCTFYSKELEQMATAGNANAQFALAGFYAEGNGVTQNDQTAINWYGKAALQGIQEAKPKILVVYNEALDTLAAAGDADAQFALANFYAEGNGVAQNTAVALDWYGAAAAQGNAEAKQKVLGSYSSALVRLAKAGDIDAATQVADFLFNGTGGATKNEKEAAGYYAIVCKAGNKSAGTKLVTMYKAYQSGRGVVKNEELANVYLAAAASAGIQEAKDIFYSKMSPQLEQAAESGDPNAMIAMARLNGWGWDQYDNCNKTGVKWILRSIEKGYIDEVLSAMKEDSKKGDRKFSEEGLVDWSRHVFDNDPEYNGLFGYDYLRGWSQKGTTPYESAYYAALLFKSEYKNRGLKTLMNQYKHPKARELYDDWYFRYDCSTYEIGSISGIGLIKGFNEVPNKVLVPHGHRDSVYDVEVPTSEELQKLSEFNPDFAINKDAVRVIRGFKTKESSIRWVLDIFMLPGMFAYGPDSYYEILYYLSYEGYGGSSNYIRLSNPYRIRFNKFADKDTRFSETINLTDTIVPGKVSEGYSNEIKSIETINAEYTIEFKDLELCKSYYKNNASKQNQRFYSVVDGITVEFDADKIYEGVHFYINSYTIKGDDGSEYSKMTKEYCASIPEDVKPIGNTFYRMSYSKPDGSKMDVLIREGHTTFDYMKEHINAALLDSLFIAESSSIVITENGEMTPYQNGMSKSEVEAQEEQRKKEEQQRREKEKWDPFWTEMTQKYGASQVKKLRNSKTWLMKGLDIRLLTEYIDMAYWTGEIRSYYGVKYKVVHKEVVHYISNANGYAQYDVRDHTLEGWKTVIRVYTKDNIIYDWVKF